MKISTLRLDTQNDFPTWCWWRNPWGSEVCPNDSYPLLNIDRIMDNSAEYKYLSFMDAYFGYNKISMYGLDMMKSTFMTEQAKLSI